MPLIEVESTNRSVALHRVAIATTVAMFPLIWFGGLTTSHQAGMSVPDWPNTYGYNMFAVPLSVWLSEHAGGIFYEHTHRLLGSLVGFLALSGALVAWGVSARPRVRRVLAVTWPTLMGLTLFSFIAMRATDGDTARRLGHAVSWFGGWTALLFVAWLTRTPEPRRWVRWMATALLLAVIVQGLLGGLRVTEVNLNLAILHGIFAQVTLCLAGLLVLVTSRWWPRWEPATLYPRPRATWWAAALTLTILAQLALAAVMRHGNAGLAIPDFPLHYGQVVPPTTQAGLEQVNDLRIYDYSLPAVTLGQIWLHAAHRIGAVAILVALLGLVWQMLRIVPARRPTGAAVWLVALVLVQICLGVATVWWRKPADLATAHVACGALLLLSSWLTAVTLWRREGWRLDERTAVAARTQQTLATSSSPTLGAPAV